MKTLSIKGFPHKLLIKLQIRALRNGSTVSNEALLLVVQALNSAALEGQHWPGNGSRGPAHQSEPTTSGTPKSAT
jgi:hypothetical protein